MSITKSLVALVTFLVIPSVFAQDQSDIKFTEGSVLIYCTAPTESGQISTKVFNEAFPKWMARLQERADEGTIARAHYLSDLKSGLFVVVLGNSTEQAMSNAGMVMSENRNILIDAYEKAGLDLRPEDERCTLIEIGPVAVLPRK